MLNPGQPRQRDLARTRRQLLDAARAQVAAHGAAVSLDAIARASGVSKGGLLHHFPSKDALLLALADDLYEKFEAAVERFAEEEAPGPGRYVRAYVRAAFDEITSPDLLLEHGTLLNLIATVPAVSQFVGAKLVGWNQRFADDGISADVARIVMVATDGAAVGMLTAQSADPSAIDGLEAQLLTLIDAHITIAKILAIPEPHRQETP